MKSLRQLLRRRSRSSNKVRPTARRKNGETTRRLSSQTLEQRQLLAGDVGTAHNHWNQYDVNQDFKLSPSDALGVINYLASSHALGEQVAGEQTDPFAGKKVDVNADGNITPSDALMVINALGRGEQMDPLVEMFLSARDANDNLLPVNNGVVQAPGVGIENSFFIEVSYTDLRDDPLGAFTIFPDIGTSRGNLITPVMRELQRVVIDNDIAQATSGTLSVGIEGSSQTVEITLTQLDDNPRQAFTDALVALGYDSTEFTVSTPAFLRGEETIPNIGIEINYTATEFGNLDMPDLIITESFDNDPQITFTEISPLNPDGSLNYAAVLTSIDTRSRTFSPFVLPVAPFTVFLNGDYYQDLNRGTFDPNTGFSDIGGVGALSQGGIPGVDARGIIEQPFDAFSIEVFLNSPVPDANPLVLDVNPGEGVDPLTLYGINDNVPDDLITLNDTARVTISTGAGPMNNPPTVSGPVVLTATEDDTPSTASLLENASDLDGDSLTVTGFSFTGGDTSGVSQNGTELSITPSAYNALKVGESEIITAAYTIDDGNGGTVAQTLTLTVSGVNDAPDAGADIATVNDEFDASFNIDLLQNASDPDGDTLDVINITQVGSEDTSGVTPDDANNRLVVNPAAYAALNNGESITITYDFDVVDGNGGTDTARVTVTINGDTPNQPLVVGDPVTLTVSEDDADTSLNLTDNVTDPDPEDTISVVNGSVTSTGDTSGITVNGNTLSITPAAYNALAVGESSIVSFNYQVTDGEGSTDDHSATVTITGVNDAPVASGPVTATVSEDDASSNVDLLVGASDPDTSDSVSVDGLTLRSGDNSGITNNGPSGLTVDPSAYNDLAVGESEVVIFDYNLIDGNGGVTAQSATITITGVNDAPTVGDPITASATEDDSQQTVDLLAGAADVDTSDSLSVADFTVTSGDGTPFAAGSQNLTFDPTYFNSLAAGESAVVEFSYNVVDGNGGSTAQSATITITGVNDAPVVSDNLSFERTEDEDPFTFSLLENASDPDTNDTLSVANVSITGDQTGISVNGDQVTVTPTAYGQLESGESIVITFTYDVTDSIESVTAVTATVTIGGAADTPTVEGPLTFTFNENDAPSTQDLLAGASDPNGDPINIINANIVSGDSRGVTVNLSNSTVSIDPTAYRDLNDGESEVIQIEYDITDDQGHTVAQTATITINGQTIVLSTISGQLFVDHIENIQDVLNGAAPVRNGVHDEGEEGLGGVTVRLLQVTSTGETELATTATDNDGRYSFGDLLPGTYVVEYDIPASVQHTGSTRGTIVIDEAGGANASGPAINAIGLVGVMQRLDLLAKTYIAQGIIDTSNLSEGLGGGSVVLNPDGTQRMFVAGEGFDAQFAEIVLNDARDAALLTIVNSQNQIVSARLTLDQFVVAGDAEGVRFFGSMEDFEFTASSEELIRDEFEDYRKAIDKVFTAEV